MSTDKPGEPSGSVGPPNEPSSARDDDKTNWKPVYAAIAIAVALTLATVLWINRPETESVDPPPGPGTTPSRAPSITQTADPREAEIAAAQKVYEKYIAAMTVMAKGGGSKKLVQKIRPYTTGDEWKAVQAEAADLRKSNLTVSGVTSVSFTSVTKIKLSQSDPSLTLRLCHDQRELFARTDDGERLNAIWIYTEARMVRSKASWRVTQRTDRVTEKSCEKA